MPIKRFTVRNLKTLMHFERMQMGISRSDYECANKPKARAIKLRKIRTYHNPAYLTMVFSISYASAKRQNQSVTVHKSASSKPNEHPKVNSKSNQRKHHTMPTFYTLALFLSDHLHCCTHLLFANDNELASFTCAHCKYREWTTYKLCLVLYLGSFSTNIFKVYDHIRVL